MKLLCDVHISYKVVNYLSEAGYETIHVNQILDRWYTKDKDICEFADKNDFIVITKDYDFRNSYFINGSPKKLIKINLGNISNIELIKILSQLMGAAEKLNNSYSFLIEIDKDRITYSDK